MTERRAQLDAALRQVRRRVQDGCVAAGRDPAEVRLLAVTKGFPVTDVALLHDLGLREFGENRVQEATAKVGEVAELRPDAGVRWHLVGQLQRNKVGQVASWAAQVQSVDSGRLATALDRAVRRARDSGSRVGPLEVLVQASLDPEEPDRRHRSARGGCRLADLPELADAVSDHENLLLRGVMAIAPLGHDSDPVFARLDAAARTLRQDHPDATEVSAGMSGDMESALRHGATCVRVGTALLGDRRLASP